MQRYTYFVDLKPCMLTALSVLPAPDAPGHLMGLYYADSTALKACHNRRIHQHKVMAGLAQRGQCSTGRFYGCRLFLVVNALREVAQAFVAPGNLADNTTTTLHKLLKGLTGQVYGNKGFINQKVLDELLIARLKRVTSICNNMKIS